MTGSSGMDMSREPVFYVTGGNTPDMLVRILSQTGFKVMQKCNFLFWTDDVTTDEK